LLTAAVPPAPSRSAQVDPLSGGFTIWPTSPQRLWPTSQQVLRGLAPTLARRSRPTWWLTPASLSPSAWGGTVQALNWVRTKVSAAAMDRIKAEVVPREFTGGPGVVVRGGAPPPPPPPAPTTPPPPPPPHPTPRRLVNKAWARAADARVAQTG
jgi:hypothetical protein